MSSGQSESVAATWQFKGSGVGNQLVRRTEKESDFSSISCLFVA